LIDVQRIVRKTVEAVWFILSLGLILNLTISEASAAQPGLLGKRMDRALINKGVNLPETLLNRVNPMK